MKSTIIGLVLWPGAILLLGCGGGSSKNGALDASTGGASSSSTGTMSEAGTACPPLNGTTIMHRDTTTDETWAGDGTLHQIPYDITIYNTVTLEPCAEVRVAPFATVSVRGALLAEGTASQAIHIGAATVGSPWAKIVTAAGTGTLRFVYTTIDGGGDPLNTAADYAGMLDVSGSDGTAVQEILHGDHLIVSGSASQGIILSSGGGFSKTSTALTITGSQGYPVNTWARLAGTLPDGDYTGNLKNEILLRGGGTTDAILEDTTLHNRGVPYHVGPASSSGEFQVATPAGAAVPTLTIEAGVELRFNPAGSFIVDHSTTPTVSAGAIVALGTADKHIIFTSASATPAAGDWMGIKFGSPLDPRNQLDYVDVNYAGAPSGEEDGHCALPVTLGASDNAAIIINDVPLTEFITNSTIIASATDGIDRAWMGDPVDFLATNSVQAARCKQSFPRPTTGSCPADPPCP